MGYCEASPKSPRLWSESHTHPAYNRTEDFSSDPGPVLMCHSWVFYLKFLVDRSREETLPVSYLTSHINWSPTSCGYLSFPSVSQLELGIRPRAEWFHPRPKSLLNSQSLMKNRASVHVFSPVPQLSKPLEARGSQNIVQNSELAKHVLW